MITMTSITVNSDQEEELKGMSREFPYSAIYGDINRYVGGFVPWHWHEAIEIIHVLRGAVSVLVGDARHSLRNGDAFFVNSNRLHSICPESGCDHVFFHTFLFEPCLLAGQYGSVFERKYVSPLICDNGISGVAFRNGDKKTAKITKALRDVFSVSREESYGYEFTVRSKLSEVWLMALEETGARFHSANSRTDMRAERIKTMIRFIRENYMRKTTLDEIASSANISERECLRCFAMTLGMSPFEYLTQFRVWTAAEALVSGDSRIIDIGESAGFSSCSYFGKTFKELMGCTPGEYRRRNGMLR